MQEGRAVAMVLLSAVLWGTTGTARALGPADASPLAIGAVRIAIGGALLVAVALWRGSLFATRWPAVASILSALAVATYQLTFFAGVAQLGVAIGTIIAIGSAPVFAGLLSWVALRERPDARWAAATTLAVVGVVLLAFPRDPTRLAPAAALLPLAAGASYAAYATASKRLLQHGDSVAVAAIAFGGGALFLLPVLAVADLRWLSEPRGIAVALWLGVGATAIAYLFFTRALARLPVSHGATLSLVEPLTATLLGMLVLGESLSVPQLFGGTLVAAGLLVLATAKRPS